MEGIAEIQVVSGSLDNLTFQMTGGGLLASDLVNGERSGAQVVPADGIVVLRTPQVVLGGGVITATPALYFNTGESSAVVRIRRCGIRQVD